MHINILNKNQLDLLYVLVKFKKEFYMVGGTAIALHIGHRQSLDFDLFKNGAIKPKTILKKFDDLKEKTIVTLNRDGQLNLSCRNVKFTFFDFGFDVPNNNIFKHINIPTLLDLAAMKAYALGRRSKWKDYVDLYFIIKHHYTLSEISANAITLFNDLYSDKLFRGQLSYFNDIDYSEQVDYMPGFEVTNDEVKNFLIDAALTGF